MSWQSHAIQLLYLLTPGLSMAVLGSFAVALFISHWHHSRLEAIGWTIAITCAVLAALNLWVFIQVLGVYLARQTLG